MKLTTNYNKAFHDIYSGTLTLTLSKSRYLLTSPLKSTTDITDICWHHHWHLLASSLTPGTCWHHHWHQPMTSLTKHHHWEIWTLTSSNIRTPSFLDSFPRCWQWSRNWATGDLMPLLLAPGSWKNAQFSFVRWNDRVAAILQMTAGLHKQQGFLHTQLKLKFHSKWKKYWRLTNPF